MKQTERNEIETYCKKHRFNKNEPNIKHHVHQNTTMHLGEVKVNQIQGIIIQIY